MSDVMKRSRREYRNISIFQLIKYRLPINAKVSILHRISGILLFLSFPFLLFLLNQSLVSQSFFDALKVCLASVSMKIGILLITWAYIFHFCAGLRHLLMDLHIGVTKESGKKSAWIVLAISIVLIALIALKLFGAF